MKLLVVDDEKDVQFLFQQKFRKEIKSGKVQIKFALSGFKTLNIIESIEDLNEYLVLVGINMHEISALSC